MSKYKKRNTTGKLEIRRREGTGEKERKEKGEQKTEIRISVAVDKMIKLIKGTGKNAYSDH